MGNITETSVFENMNQFDTSLNETIFGSSYLVGVSEPGSRIRNISLLALLDEGGALTNNDGTRFPQQEINEIHNLCIVWNFDGEYNIHQIYNHDTGEVYWEDHDENWTDGDELILSSLLMYADLESTII